MALSHAILALLSNHPGSGYDITKTFASSVGSFWKATHQQIYRELAKLEEQGWVSVEVIAQRDRPDKKLYHLTDQGKQALIAWIAQPCDVAPVKDELLVKVFAGSLVAPDLLLQEIDRHRQLHAATLAGYQQAQAQFFPHPETLPPPALLPYLTLRRGIRYEQDWIAWCDEVTEALELKIKS